jgi:predicted Zn-dependent protease
LSDLPSLASRRRNARRAVLGLALAAGFALTGCEDPSVLGGLGQSLVPPSEEVQMGNQAWAELKAKTPIDHDPALHERVERVGRRIVAASGSEIPPSRWDFVVFDSPEINAFALPGGHVGVYKGLFNVVQDDAQLATVLGHEIGHVNAHHPAQRAGVTAAENGLLGIGSALLGLGQVGTMVAQAAGQYGVLLPFSRTQESQADRLGLTYMARAGYDPAEALTFWQRMSQATARNGHPFALLSTHPPDAQRIEQLKTLLPEAERIYREHETG